MTYYYVSTSGNNNNSGTSSSSPFKTINYAVSRCGSGDTVYVRKGTYTEGISITRSGTKSNYNTLANYQNENVIIKRSDIYNHGISVSANFWVIDGFEITNTWHPITVGKGYHDIIMKNLDCHRNGYSLVLNDGSYNLSIKDSIFHHPHSGSTNFIGLRGEDDFISHHITIKNCTFNDCGHNSINFYTSYANQHYDGTMDVLIEGCNFNNDKQVAIFTNWCGVTRMIVRNCHFDHCSRGIQAVMRDCLIEDCVVVDHGHHFVYSQADANSWDVTVRDINAHAGTWGSPNPCINLFKGHNFYVYCITATGNFSRTSTPGQIPDPRPSATPTPIPTLTPSPSPTPSPTPPPTPTPIPTIGSIQCTCNVTATITLNHLNPRITPYTYHNVPVGHNLVRFEKTDYNTNDQWIYVYGGQTVGAHATLIYNPLTTFPIDFKSYPTSANIFKV